MPPPLRVFLAFGAYAALHSLLLTEGARAAGEALVGRRLIRGWFLWLGSVHEERRLLTVYGAAYRRYREATPRFWPRGPA